MNKIVKLTCPPLIIRHFSSEKKAESIMDELRHFAKNVNLTTPQLIGLEQQVAFDFFVNDGVSSIADNTYWRAKAKVLLSRPSVEPIVFAFSATPTADLLSHHSRQNIASALLGKPAVARTAGMIGRSSLGDVRFEEVTAMVGWYTAIEHACTGALPAPLVPHYIFARVVFAHPFMDGNGRYARWLVHHALARLIEQPLSFLPLGPIHYLYAERIGHALRELSINKDWSNYFEIYTQVLETSLRIARKHFTQCKPLRCH
jgi:hypothetical protein